MARKRKRPAAAELTPNIKFGATNLLPRCQTVWTRLFETLYDLEVIAEFVPEVRWTADVKNGRVTIAPVPSKDYDETDLWASPPTFSFQVDDLPARSKKRSGDKVASDGKLQAEFTKWLSLGVVETFELEPVDVEYSWFNETEDPFSVSLEIVDDKSKPKVLWSNTRQVARPKRRQVKPRPKRKDYSVGGWRRFYFDDGSKRVFWFIQCKGSTQTIAQGKIGAPARESTKRLKSPKEAKESARQAVEKKLAEGFIEYDDKDFQYRRKNRLAHKQIQKDMKEFEESYDLRIAEEYRRHLLEKNGGGLAEASAINLAGHRLRHIEIYDILGFAGTELAYQSAIVHLPRGYTLVAGIKESWLVLDDVGAVRLFDMEQFDERDVGDDNSYYLDHLPSHVVANSFDELLTRIRRFPNDVHIPSGQKNATPKIAIDTAALISKARTKAEQLTCRRFFFDDGKLQKYWHIERSGCGFTTSYNKYGWPPSDTTKTFPDEDSARKAYDKIVAQKQKKGYVEVIPDALTLERKSSLRVATEKAVEKFEAEIGFELPQEYRQFLRTRNGGTPTPGFVELPGISYIANVEVQYMLGLYTKSEAGKDIRRELSSYQLPNGHLPIAVGRDLFTLSLKWKRGCVFFWDPEFCDFDRKLRNQDAHLIAHSFDEFLTRIALFGEPKG